jgi:hypothetical protein
MVLGTKTRFGSVLEMANAANPLTITTFPWKAIFCLRKSDEGGWDAMTAAFPPPIP